MLKQGLLEIGVTNQTNHLLVAFRRFRLKDLSSMLSDEERSGSAPDENSLHLRADLRASSESGERATVEIACLGMVEGPFQGP